jgi:hypothetical protein
VVTGRPASGVPGPRHAVDAYAARCGATVARQQRGVEAHVGPVGRGGSPPWDERAGRVRRTATGNPAETWLNVTGA